MGLLSDCTPRKEVLKGDLDDAIFAADFGDLIAGKAAKVYGDAKTFFQNTHPAKQLCKIVQAVFERLAATKEGGATIRLSTGFGGGKTHTLMALWHLAKNIEDPSLGTELLPAAGRPESVKAVAVDASKAGVPEFSKHGKVKVHSLWGEVFIYGRKVTDFDPIGEESAQVICRRLFERIDSSAAQSASATYHSLYERVSEESPGALPASAATTDYAQRIVRCYPFHPRMLDTARNRLGSLQDFQKSRGVLRLFARILRDVVEAGQDIELVSAGDINWTSPRIQADLLDRLDRREFKAAIAADVKEHAGELDGGADRGLHCRVASALLLESIPMDSNSGMDPADLTLAVLQPDEAGPEPAEAMDHLMGVCWHTYPTASGRGCQFRYQPNVLKQIEERMSDVPLEDARSRVLSEAQGYFQGINFKPAAWPTAAKQVSESASLQLALCETEELAKVVCAYSDNSDPAAPMPRGFQNAIFAVTATPSALNNAIEGAQRLLSADGIQREHKSGESGRLVREQLKKILPKLTREFAIQTRRAVRQGGGKPPLCRRYGGRLVVRNDESFQ